MKRIFSLFLLTAMALGLAAKPQFQQGRKYQIMCQQYPDGCATIGSAYNKLTPVYYLQNGGSTDDCYWYITEEEPGYYSIRNARTSQYITYTDNRSDGTGSGNDIRYIGLTESFDEDDAYKSFWTIEVYQDNYFVIRNASATTHIWDLRVSPSFVVGTYESNNVTQNQRFAFYDEDGNLVQNIEEAVSGYDVSSWLVADADNASTNWTNREWSHMEGWGTYYNGDASIVVPFFEKWTNKGQTLSNAELYQTVKNLPPGNYTLQADMIAVQQSTNTPSQRGVTLFVGNQSTAASTNDGVPQRYTIDFNVDAEGSSINLGARIQNTTANWVALDNLTLRYHAGSDEALRTAELIKIKADLANDYTSEEIDTKTATLTTFDELEKMRKFLMNHFDKPQTGPLFDCASDITIKGRTPIYAGSLGLYLCAIAEKHFGTNFTDTIAYTPINGYGTMSIDGTPVPSGETYTFENVTAGKTYTISFSNGTETVSYPLTFTSLNIVSLTGDFNYGYSFGQIQVCQPSKKKAELLNMKAKWRGGITNSNGKNKRNYHVKLLDENGQKLEKRYFELRKDNSWILESCQVDMSRIRNRVLTDLWNDYHRPPYYIDQEPEALTGTRGEFAEVILNGEYRGIYCMTENMDRKQMKLKKYDETTLEVHGQLWKSKDWSYATLMGTSPDGNYYPKTYLSTPNGQSESWDSYNVKYPDIDEVYPTDWTTLYNAVDFVAHASDDDFKAHVAEYFDLPVVIDYYILMETILATDNHGKNMFFGVYDKQVDKKITFAVWDMDATCGQRWSDDYYHNTYLLGPEQDYADFIATQEHGDYNLFKRLRDTDPDNFNLRVAKRYRELRQNYFQAESILNRFRTYFLHFQTAGADQREYARWNGNSDIAGHTLNFYDEQNTTDMNIEYNYLTDWFTRRLAYLDTNRFDLANLPANGDVDLDGKVSLADAQAIAEHMLGRAPATDTFSDVFADVNGDGRITLADVTATVNIALGRKQSIK